LVAVSASSLSRSRKALELDRPPSAQLKVRVGLMVPKFTINGEGYDRLDKWKPGERVDLVGHPYYLKRRA
jgi:hypothetical protein